MPTKDEVIARLNEVEDGEFILRTKEEEAQFLENFENDRIGKRIGEVHGQYDNDIKEVTGIERQQGEKTYDYNKRVLRTLKEKSESKSDEKLTARIEELQSQLEKASNAKEVKALMGKINELNETHQSQLSEYQQKLTQKDVEFDVRTGLVGMEFSDLIPEEVRKTFINKSITEITKKGQVIDGKVVYVGEDGEILRNKDTMAPLTSSDLLKDSLKEVLKEGRKQTGVGSKKAAPKGEEEIIEIPTEGLKSKDDIIKAMREAGIAYGSKQWDETYIKLRKQLS